MTLRSLGIVAWLAGCGTETPAPGGPPPAVEAVTWTTIEGSKGADAALGRAIASSDKVPVLFVGATWCGTCKAYKAARTDPRMATAHRPVHIIEVDAERHVKLIEALHVKPAGVPHWEVLDRSGAAVGASIDGRAWTLNTVGSMADALGPFFAAQAPAESR